MFSLSDIDKVHVEGNKVLLTFRIVQKYNKGIAAIHVLIMYIDNEALAWYVIFSTGSDAQVDQCST